MLVHILASFAFTLVAVGAIGLVALMLMRDQDKIVVALGIGGEIAPRALRPQVRVRSAGRWQAASATTAHPSRAAA